MPDHRKILFQYSLEYRISDWLEFVVSRQTLIREFVCRSVLSVHHKTTKVHKKKETMSRSDDPGHYFQTSDALATSERKAAKAKNKRGHPVVLPSKILAVQADPLTDGSVYVAEAAGEVKRVVVEVCKSVWL